MRNEKTIHKKIAILGYGSQGRAVALNLRDSGFNVAIGLPEKSDSRSKAAADGFQSIFDLSTATQSADIICFAFPDHLHGRVYDAEIRENLRPGQTLWFLHALSVHFGFIKPPSDCDLILIAPHAPGLAVREKYLTDKGISAFLAIQNDATGQAEETALVLANAVGFLSERIVKTTFKHEAVGDLFGEQAILCGGMAALIKGGFETLVANGLTEENAYLEVAYQLDLIIALIKQFGIEGMLARISVAARMGALEAGPKIIDNNVLKRMQELFDSIASGDFPSRLNALTPEQVAQINERLGELSSPAFEKAARKFQN
ncbi:MAG: ketol-acid reductoisomerase [bacterium]|nr:ketol-acid reductoisomerase [bacterium]